jgi:hypothetical protein
MRDRYVIDFFLGLDNLAPTGVNEVAAGYLHLVPNRGPVRLVENLPPLDLCAA